MYTLPTVKRPNGRVIYRGPSLIDGAPIVVIVTGLREGSSNGKTGAMLQTWILRADVAPLEALMTGADASVCGDCPHRTVDGAGSCYVNVGQGPSAVYDAFRRGTYPEASAEELAGLADGRMVRLGTYGDPLAVPAEVWEALISRAEGHTGYTHAWRKARAAAYRRFLMASADTAQEAKSAQAKGWRTFRVKDATDPVLAGEITCPAAEEAGKRRTCETCGACDGAGSNPGRVSITLNAHGLAWKVQRFRRMVKAKGQKRRYRIRRTVSA